MKYRMTPALLRVMDLLESRATVHRQMALRTNGRDNLTLVLYSGHRQRLRSDLFDKLTANRWLTRLTTDLHSQEFELSHEGRRALRDWREL